MGDRFKPAAQTGSSSRFVSQKELDEAQQRREDAVRETYAKLGQEPPPEALAAARKENVEYDPRTLFERLKANKDAKQEAFDEKMKLSNQFRGLDDGETEFLQEVERERRAAELAKEEETKREMEEFRKAAQSREAVPSAAITASVKPGAPPDPSSSKPKSKRKREGLPGIVRRKDDGKKRVKEGSGDGG